MMLDPTPVDIEDKAKAHTHNISSVEGWTSSQVGSWQFYSCPLYSSHWTWTVAIGGNLGYAIPNALSLPYTQTSGRRMKLCPTEPGPACVRVLPFSVTGSLHLDGFLKSLSQWREVPEENFLVADQLPSCRPLCGSGALKCTLTLHRARVTCHAYFFKC